jgi:hypothetical protein
MLACVTFNLAAFALAGIDIGYTEQLIINSFVNELVKYAPLSGSLDANIE